jgi:fructokinase
MTDNIFPEKCIVDIGGTWIRVAACMTDALRFRSPDDYNKLLNQVTEAVLRANPRVQKLYVSAPGLIDSRGYVRKALYSCITGHTLRADMEKLLSVPTILENDARCQALGCMRPSENLIYLSFGSGVGGTATVNGQPLYGRNGLAGEFGHITLMPRGPQCACGKRGCLDAMAGGKSLEGLFGVDWFVSPVKQQVLKAFPGMIDATYRLMDMLRGIFDPDRIVLAGHLCVHPEFKAAIEKYAVTRRIETEALSDTWPLVLRWVSHFK